MARWPPLLCLALLLSGCLLPADPGGTGSATASGTSGPATGTPTASGPTGGPGVPVPYRVLETGWSSGIATDGFAGRTLWDQAAWEAFWAEHKSNTNEPGTPPAVDFARETVAVVFLGVKPSGGYAVEVTNVTWAYNSLRVQSLATEPGPDCGTAAVETQPFQIVAVRSRYTFSSREGTYTFLQPETRRHDCG